MSAFVPKLLAALTAVPLMAVSVPASPAAAEATGAHVGGIIATDTTWTAAGGPYLVDGPLQIADNATLRLEPGVNVEATAAFTANAPMFGVAGTLDIAGSESSPVTVDGGGTFGLTTGLNVNTDALIKISHADVADFRSLIPATGNSQHADFDITDSTFADMPYFSYFWYPYSYARVERNLFVDVGALTFGTDQNAVATVANNRFRGTSSYPFGSDYRHALESWAAYGEPMQVHGNTFERAVGQTYALKVVTDGAADATGNDWGTTSVAAAKARILDQEDDLNLPSVVPVEPLLDSPAPSTPTAAPIAPSAATAVADDTSAVVSWSAPAENGGSPITAYTVTSSPGGHTVAVPGSQTTGTITGLTNGTAYTFTVTATNAVGTSPASAPSNTVTPKAAPAAPIGVSATRGDQQATIAWTASNANGSPVTGYTIASSPGGVTKTVGGDQTTGAVTGLTNGTAYTFTVTATNAAGTSPASAPSAAVTPAAKPERVAKPTVKVDGRKSIIKWTAPNDGGSAITGYRVIVNGKARMMGADARKLVLKRLKPARYKVKVAAVNGVGAGRTSDVAKFRIRVS